MKHSHSFKIRGGAPLNACSERLLAYTCRLTKAPRSAWNCSGCAAVGGRVPRPERTGFTLTEILLSIAIVGVIAALILPSIVTNYQNRALEIGFEREIKTISGAVRNLAVSENKVDFFSTIMYSDTEPDGYDDTSGKFVKKYLKVSRYCGDSNGDCFSDKYYTYDGTTHKKEIYEPIYKGACASLKNGASICITPQIGLDPITGLIDINGKKGPNVYNRDLRPFTINMNVEKTSLSGTSTEVLSTTDPDLEPSKKSDGPCAESSISKDCCDTQSVKAGDACCIWYKSQVGHPCYEAPSAPENTCELDPYGLDCCRTKTKSISYETHPCCTHSEIAKSVNVCRKVTISFECDDKNKNKYPLALDTNFCHFKQTGYNDGARYGIFVLLHSSIECKRNGQKINCNDFSLYDNKDKRFFDKNNLNNDVDPMRKGGCQLIRDNIVLRTYDWKNECIQGITYTYTPND